MVSKRKIGTVDSWGKRGSQGGAYGRRSEGNLQFSSVELPGRPGDDLDVEPRGLWVDAIPCSHCILKATLALHSCESVSGTGTSGEFKKLP